MVECLKVGSMKYCSPGLCLSCTIITFKSQSKASDCPKNIYPEKHKSRVITVSYCCSQGFQNLNSFLKLRLYFLIQVTGIGLCVVAVFVKQKQNINNASLLQFVSKKTPFPLWLIPLIEHTDMIHIFLNSGWHPWYCIPWYLRCPLQKSIWKSVKILLQ